MSFFLPFFLGILRQAVALHHATKGVNGDNGSFFGIGSQIPASAKYRKPTLRLNRLVLPSDPLLGIHRLAKRIQLVIDLPEPFSLCLPLCDLLRDGLRPFAVYRHL